jgi:AhpD family alkylhydroperoxidase
MTVKLQQSKRHRHTPTTERLLQAWVDGSVRIANLGAVDRDRTTFLFYNQRLEHLDRLAAAGLHGRSCQEIQMTQRLDENAASPAGVKALDGVYGHIMQSGLPKALVDLVCRRVSQINGCAYCFDMHSRDLVKESMTIEKLVLVPGLARGRSAVRQHRMRGAYLGRDRDAVLPKPACRIRI